MGAGPSQIDAPTVTPAQRGYGAPIDVDRRHAQDRVKQENRPTTALDVDPVDGAKGPGLGIKAEANVVMNIGLVR